MKVIKINGRPVTSGQYEIMLGENEDVNSLDVSDYSCGSVAYTADRSKIYVLDTDCVWQEVKANSSSSSSGSCSCDPAGLPTLTNFELEEMLT